MTGMMMTGMMSFLEISLSCRKGEARGEAEANVGQEALGRRLRI